MTEKKIGTHTWTLEAPTKKGPPTKVPMSLTYCAPLPNGKILTRVPFCWCGEGMVGKQLPFITDGFDVNWWCEQHGNDGLEVSYLEYESPFVAALSNHDIKLLEEAPLTFPKEQ